MIRSRIALTGIVLIALAAGGRAEETYKIDNARSTISFGIRHFVGTAKGKFTLFGGIVHFDRDHPERSAVEANIQVDSIDTGIRKRDEHLRSTEFFEVGKFPQIVFKSRSVTRKGRESGEIIGDLTIRGVTRPVTLQVKLLSPLSERGGLRWEVTTAPLPRRDFGLMFSPGTEAISGIGREISIKMQIETVKAR
jgi:polyisoprenoid-binding protein YceI